MVTYILKRVDALRSLLDFTANNLGDQLSGKLSQSSTRSLSRDDIGHLLADSTDLRCASVCSLLDLVGPSLRESDGEQAEEVVVGGLDGDICFNQGLPFTDE